VVELLIASMMALLVLGATIALFVSSQRGYTSLITKAGVVQGVNTSLNQMTEDLRQAYQVEYPVSTTTSPCAETTSTGVQTCNVIDVLAHLTSSGYSGTDFEIRYDCSVASTTITGDQSCWRYLCSASAATGSGSTCTSTSGSRLLASRLVIDDLTNGTTSDPVFSLCYPNTATTGASCASGAARPTSGTVTIKTPVNGTTSAAAGGDQATMILSSGIFMPDLTYDQ
jgi:Tfp pilus assembly protein PilW